MCVSKYRYICKPLEHFAVLTLFLLHFSLMYRIAQKFYMEFNFTVLRLVIEP